MEGTIAFPVEVLIPKKDVKRLAKKDISQLIRQTAVQAVKDLFDNDFEHSFNGMFIQDCSEKEYIGQYYWKPTCLMKNTFLGVPDPEEGKENEIAWAWFMLKFSLEKKESFDDTLEATFDACNQLLEDPAKFSDTIIISHCTIKNIAITPEIDLNTARDHALVEELMDTEHICIDMRNTAEDDEDEED